jgi:hypothetical protein
MGMYDFVECAANLPGGSAIAGKKFQTNSLYRVLGRFSISSCYTTLSVMKVKMAMAPYPL